MISLPELLFVNVTESLSDNQMQDFSVMPLCFSFFFFFPYHAAVVVVIIPPFDPFDFQTKVRRSKIKELFSSSLIKTSVTTSRSP